MGNDVEILEILHDIQNNVNVLTTKFEYIETTVNKHESCIYGIPQEMGKGGLLYTVSGLSKRVDSIRSTFAVIWTGIVGIVSTVISAIIVTFYKSNK